MSNPVPCETVGMLLQLLERIPEDANIRINGKKVMFREDYNSYTIYLDTVENDKDDYYRF